VIANAKKMGRNRPAYAAPLASDQTRAAFTLVEMLAVIAIIAVLASLVAVGTIKVIASQRSSNTQNAMRTIQKVLNEHWTYVASEAKKETGLEGPYATMDAIFGPDTTGGERNRIIWIKMRLMEAFPISYMEIQAPPKSNSFFPYDANIIPIDKRKYYGTYQKLLGKLTADKTLAPNNAPAHLTESSACLLMALSIPRNGAALNVDNLGSATVLDTDGDGISEFIDAWGNPLTFYRFPTKNLALQSSSPTPSNSPKATYHDPWDPSGVLFNWKGIQRTKMFEPKVHAIAFDGTDSVYVLPTIVSPGPDGMLGLDAFMAVANPAQEADNIYSFQLR
jgi:prepilin-type N-terminal cleavage/methylation domain-containing protein